MLRMAQKGDKLTGKAAEQAGMAAALCFQVMCRVREQGKARAGRAPAQQAVWVSSTVQGGQGHPKTSSTSAKNQVCAPGQWFWSWAFSACVPTCTMATWAATLTLTSVCWKEEYCEAVIWLVTEAAAGATGEEIRDGCEQAVPPVEGPGFRAAGAPEAIFSESLPTRLASHPLPAWQAASPEAHPGRPSTRSGRNACRSCR